MDKDQELMLLRKELNDSLEQIIRNMDVILHMTSLIEGYVVAQEALKVVSPDTVDHLMQTVPQYVEVSVKHEQIIKDPLGYFKDMMDGV